MKAAAPARDEPPALIGAAVIDARRRWSPGRLAGAIDTVAEQLASAGVGRGDRVAVLLPRDAWLPAALLAIRRLGAAYVPLDADFPPARLGDMVDDAGVRGCLVAGPAPDWLARRPGIVAIDLGSLAEPVEAPVPPDGLLPPAAHPDDLAYVIYTSGSTGRPKGVAVRQRNLDHLLTHLARTPGLAAGRRLLSLTTLSFDMSVPEFFLPSAVGATLVLGTRDDARDPQRIAALIEAHGIDHLQATPSTWHLLLDAGWRAPPGFVAWCGGEPLTPALAQALTAQGITLWNLYGPTETTVWSTCGRVRPGDGPIDIGEPIGDTQVHILDEEGRPCDAGVPGELCLGGAGVAAGYLNRPDLTAVRFVPDPFSAAPGARLYRTGDLARRSADGRIEHLGRLDFQVKVDGHRIELGEIEAVLDTQPSVSRSVVVAMDVGGSRRLVAHVAPRPGATCDPQALRAALHERLPAYMVPTHVMVLPALPQLVSGKIDRAALPVPTAEAAPAGRAAGVGDAGPPTPLAAVRRAFATVLGLADVAPDAQFFDAGGTSLLAARAVQRLREAGWPTLRVVDLFAHPDVPGLAAHLDTLPRSDGVAAPAGSPSTAASAPDDTPAAPTPVADATTGPVADPRAIAIIGMAGRFPGAADVDAFWDNLVAGRDTITRFRPEDLDPAIPAAERTAPGYVAARGVLDDVASFDPTFFGIAPREAELMDPQHRLFMEVCWEALERAGHVDDARSGPIGVYAGAYAPSYLVHHVMPRRDRVEAVGELAVMFANDKDYLPTRVAHGLGLTGPAVAIGTACSTSLVAVAQAVDALRGGRCRIALAGGSAVTCPPASGYRHVPGGMLSPDGTTRPFSDDAQGTVFSDGVAVVVLKRLADALADGDPVVAVIRGAAVNNDGRGKASFTAPSVAGQAAVVRAALDDAGLRADAISLVEAHGTATPMGDPIEVEALTRVFRADGAAVGGCRLGSVKSNVGHLVTAAGAAGLIKTALALQHRQVPASLHWRAPNPAIAAPDSPFVVQAQTGPWPDDGRPRRAGVTSLGVGGTNAHVIVEEAPVPGPVAATDDGAPVVLRVSGRTPELLRRTLGALADRLSREPALRLADVGHTLHVGRRGFAQRWSGVARSTAEAAALLRAAAQDGGAGEAAFTPAPPCTWLFPGQGSQYPAMGRALRASDPVFARALDEAIDAVRPHVDAGWRDRWLGDGAAALVETRDVQPALLCVQWALAQAWRARGLVPAAMVGHSVGEFTAAALAGVMSLADAARAVALRAQAMQACAAGAMLSVRAPAEDVLAWAGDALDLAADNAPSSCVVAGPGEAVDRLQAVLLARGIAHRRLATSHAFHSRAMDAAVTAFEAVCRTLTLRAPSLPIVSTATGRPLQPEQATDPGYWARHLRQPVRFGAAVRTRLAEAADGLFLEVGPRAGLAALVLQNRPAAHAGRIACVSSLDDAVAREDEAFASAVGRLWTLGLDVAAPPAAGLRRVVLPTSPWQHRRLWLDAVPPAPDGPSVGSSAAARSPSPIATPSPLPAPDAPQQTPSSSAPMTVVQAAPPADAFLARAIALLEDVSGLDLATAPRDATFAELGLDSLTLTQVAGAVRGTFGLDLSFRDLLQGLRSIGGLADWLARSLPAPAPTPDPIRPEPVTPATLTVALPVPDAAIGSTPADAGALERVIAQQRAVMQAQLAALRGGAAAPTATVSAPSTGATATSAPTAATATTTTTTAAATLPAAGPDPGVAARPATDAAAAPETTLQAYDVKKAFGAIARIHTRPASTVSPRELARLAEFIGRYNAHSAGSKAYTQANRTRLADPRVVNGFRPETKEIAYPLVIARSQGARLWDVDGNEYVDALSGFGMNLFGWQPPFVTEAVMRQLQTGVEIGPQHPLAGEVASLVCELTGHDRAALCNTGSEAVMGTVRIARTVTGRPLIATFSNSYHGIFDEVIVRGGRDGRARPAAPGIVADSVRQVLVLDYGAEEALRTLRERAGDIAAVLVEPVQSRRPELQPQAFLQALRRLCDETGIVLVFDEVITGFRCHLGGAQALFGVKADLASYGKVIGGGHPIGVVAGQARYMDALDGGFWQYGDDSVPTAGVTYFAGTFVRHPVALAAAKASLEHLKAAGPALQEDLNRRTADLAARMNAYAAATGAPVQIRQFSSLWRITFTEDHPLQDLLFAMMRLRGVHILDNFPCYLTTAHGPAEVDALVAAFTGAVDEMQASGFFPAAVTAAAVAGQPATDFTTPPVAGARLGRNRRGDPAWYVPDEARPGSYRELA